METGIIMSEKLDLKDNKNWKEKLTSEQYSVAREKGTERPFTGEYDDFFIEGDYYCICCEAHLFSSKTKYNSGCGWPAFSDHLDNDNLKFIEDSTHNMVRTEVLCSNCDAHLGHVFDGEQTETGKRYCINSVSMKFKATN